MKKIKKNTSMGIALGMCLGVSIGTALGSAYDNMALGSLLGCSIGFLLGFTMGSQKDERVNKQVEEKGYTIKSITFIDEKKKYAVIITDNAEEEITVMIPKSQMKAVSFAVGDIVFLEDDGSIEQVFSFTE